MIKKILFSLMLFLAFNVSFAQRHNVEIVREPQAPLSIEEYTLPNGLKVYLNPDPIQNMVFGAVVVKGGSKRDPKDATGIAHYLEHMMFKGTTEIGTIDFPAERILLDSITLLYDQLAKTTDDAQRKIIQKNINVLSLRAADYAIPGEMDRLLNSIGSTNLNAFTSEENIVYFNMFPGAHIEKWMEIYSHRFESPIFRLFQSELETVYEEKNMYSDNSFYTLFETYSKNFYRKSPYGQQTVLGSIEHLKNPSLSKMYEYFSTYYVANNMALILSGDFDPDFVKPLIAQKFGAWRQGEIKPLPDFREEAFKGREQVKVRMTPIKIGILGFRTFPKGHPDSPVFEVMSQLLSNGSSTGLLDKLYVDNKILGAGMFNQQYEENGGAIVFFIPKIVGQSLKKAESLVLGEFDKLKKGEFSDDDLASAILNLRKQKMQSLEHPMQRGMAIIEAFNMNMDWQAYLKYENRVSQVTKADIQRIATMYFDKNYLALHSKTGFPKKHKLEKPPYDPVIPKNSEANSSFSEKLKALRSVSTPPRFIEFGSDVKWQDLSNGSTFYYVDNPINQLFSLDIRFGVGYEILKDLRGANQILDMAHPKDMELAEFKKALNRLGTEYYIYATEDYTTISISGFDENLEESLQLIGLLIQRPEVDKKHLKKIMEAHKASVKSEKKEPAPKGYALFEYALYGNESDYLTRYSGSEIKKLNADSLIRAAVKSFEYQADIFYAGTRDMQTVAGMLRKLNLPGQTIASNSPLERPRKEYNENTIYLMNDPKAIQSQIHIYTDGIESPPDEMAVAIAFNEYFGGSMASIVFQEIREYRSLAYSAYANYNMPFYNHNSGYLRGFMSTQADKTTEALTIFSSLINKMPMKPERIDNLRSTLTETTRNEKPGFRNLAVTVAYHRKKGYSDDPKKQYLKVYEKLEFNQIADFYTRHICNKPIVICIVTDVKRINMEELKKFGKVIEVKREMIFRD